MAYGLDFAVSLWGLERWEIGARTGWKSVENEQHDLSPFTTSGSAALDLKTWAFKTDFQRNVQARHGGVLLRRLSQENN